MLTFLAILSGSLLAITIAQNGDLAVYHGNYHATVMVHAVGLVCILIWMLLKRERFRIDPKTPFVYLMGGVLGVLTVVLNNLCFVELGVSITLALGLLGSCLAGGIADHFGLFGLTKKPFRRQHILSLGLIAAGTAVMMLF